MEKELIILAIYVDVGHSSQQQVQQQMFQMISNYKDLYQDINKDIKIYWFPVMDQETRVECIYPPPSVIHNEGVIENELLKIYKLIVNSKNEEAKEIVRHIERKLKFKKITDKINET